MSENSEPELSESFFSSSYEEISKYISEQKKDGYPAFHMDKNKMKQLMDSYKTRQRVRHCLDWKENVVSGMHSDLLKFKTKMFQIRNNVIEQKWKLKKLEDENADLKRNVHQYESQLGLLDDVEDVPKKEFVSVIPVIECNILNDKLKDEQQKASDLEAVFFSNCEDIMNKESSIEILQRQLHEAETAVLEREEYLTASLLQVAEVFEKSVKEDKQESVRESLEMKMRQLENELQSWKEELVFETTARKAAEARLAIAGNLAPPPTSENVEP